MRCAAVVCGAFSSAAAVSAGQPPARARLDAPAVTARRATAAIHVDGRLDEPDWASTPSIGPLTQREPAEGQPASERTDVRVLFDEQAIYVGIVCVETHPNGIVSTQLTRDANLDVDDRVTIVFDPFFDHRNGFFFQVNPAGARSDGQISNNAQSLTRDWDGIWNAAVTRSADRWTAEIAIPFKTLRFRPDQTVWGFNVERQIKHLFETDRWAAARVTSWIGNLADAGQLTGLEGARQGHGLDVRPYVSGGRGAGDGQFTGGVDVFKNLTPNLNASITVNTDFAETEADIRQVNLTRFPLFFPEKRAFFLEGAGVFDVAGLAGGTDLIPFFTRRIGIHGDEDVGGGEVPIGAGAKIVGRQADYNVGVLDVETRDLPEGSLSRQNLFAARVSRNLFEQSWIGAIVTMYAAPVFRRYSGDERLRSFVAGVTAAAAGGISGAVIVLALDQFTMSSAQCSASLRSSPCGVGSCQNRCSLPVALCLASGTISFGSISDVDVNAGSLARCWSAVCVADEAVGRRVAGELGEARHRRTACVV